MVRGQVKIKSTHLGGAEEAAVTVIWWAHSVHPHKPLLPPEAEFPGSGFLLELPKRPDVPLAQELSH